MSGGARSSGSAGRLLRYGVVTVEALLTTVWLKLHGVECGLAKCRGRQPRITGGRGIRLGARAGFRGTVTAVSLATADGGRLTVGDRCFFNQGVTIHASSSVQIGAHVFIGDYAAIYDTDFHELVPGTDVRVADVVIGDDVWISRGATVLPGVTVGRGAVIGAGAVVTRDVPAFSVVAGNPATVVRQLESFPPGTHRSTRSDRG